VPTAPVPDELRATLSGSGATEALGAPMPAVLGTGASALTPGWTKVDPTTASVVGKTSFTASGFEVGPDWGNWKKLNISTLLIHNSWVV